MKVNLNQMLRGIGRNKLNSIIMIVGLSVAFSIFLVIFSYLHQEFSYNGFYAGKEKIFRINYQLKYANGQTENAVYLDWRVAGFLTDKIPQIDAATALRTAHQPTLKFENQIFDEDLKIAQAGFFRVFDFPVITGNKKGLLSTPNEIVITEAFAKKLSAIKSCKLEDLIGQPVFSDRTGDVPFIISAILKDVPKNSSIQFSALIPFEHDAQFNQSNNLLGNATIFYRIKDGEIPVSVEKLVRETISEPYTGLIKKKIDQAVLLNSKDVFAVNSSRLDKVYLEGFSSDNEKSNDKTNLYILLMVGLLLLVIATSNFILLSVGQSIKNAEKISIHRTMGANRVHIFMLYFTEHLTITFIALLLGMGFGYFLLPEFNRLAANELYRETINLPLVGIAGLSGALIIALLSSILLLKTSGRHMRTMASPGKITEGKSIGVGAFITLQYGLSLFLIILTLFVARQTNFMQSKDLGFSSENIINITTYLLKPTEKQTLKNKLLSHAGIVDLTFTNRNYISGRSSEEIQNERGEIFKTRTLLVDNNYVPTLDLKLLKGRNFSGETDEKQSILINEKLANQLFPNENPIGQPVNMYGANYQVIGVLKDYHYDSMKEEIQPLILFPGAEPGGKGYFMLVRYHPAQLSGTLAFVKEAWKEIVPQQKLDLNFWDQQLEQRYGAEERWSKIIGSAALIAIILSSLGLFSLTVLIINKRTKEIGIRKVNGAKVSEILAMLNSDFIKWVALSFAIATPIAWYIMNRWLESFAYRTTLSWWIFALSGVLALGIALLTVSWQSWKAATRNPVDALRNE